METVHQSSAGGIVYRIQNDEIELAVIKTASEGRWQLPKGLIDPGETPEIAALREVREEAGIVCEIVSHVDDIEYWFVASYDDERKRYNKKVHFFLMTFLEGNLDDHDDEVEEARWIQIDEAIRMLAFDSEKALVGKAKARIK